MNVLRNGRALAAVCAAGLLVACSHTPKSPDISRDLRRSLDQAGLQKVSLSQDRDEGVVTLSGNVRLDSEKARADAIARSVAAGQVVSDQIVVLPAGAESEAKAVNSDLDKGIEQNLDAVLIQSKLHDQVKAAVKSQVVTLTGDVTSQEARREAAKLAASVPNVLQVVNELQVKNQKATSQMY
jgi:hyperosmotically inducible periplasmic protein